MFSICRKKTTKLINRIATETSVFSDKTANTLVKKNAISADSDEYLNKKAIVIQVTINNIPETGDRIATMPRPVATPLPPENFNQIG